MHQLARQGKLTDSIVSRQTQIFSLQVSLKNDHQLLVDVRCSHGTYIRSLGEALAQKLGTLGHLTELRRVSYFFQDGQEVQLPPVVSLEECLAQPEQVSLSIDQLTQLLPSVTLRLEHLRAFLLGKWRRAPLKLDGWFLVRCQGQLFGIVFLEQGKIHQRLFLNDSQESPIQTPSDL